MNGNAYDLQGNVVQKGDLAAWAVQGCVSAAGLTITVDGESGHPGDGEGFPSVGVAPGNVPEIAWNAAPSAGDCVLESFVSVSVPRRTYNERNDFASGTGSNGSLVAAAPMGSSYAAKRVEELVAELELGGRATGYTLVDGEANGEANENMQYGLSALVGPRRVVAVVRRCSDVRGDRQPL